MLAARHNAASDLTTWDSMDRTVTIDFRSIGLSRGAVFPLYSSARADRPISYDIANDLLRLQGAHIGILTGAAVPGFLPKGENDGPLGAMVLGHALHLLGYRVTLITEAELLDLLDAMFDAYGTRFEVVELSKDDPEDHARTAPELDGLISIEKLGSNSQHVMHGATGLSRNGTRAHVDGLVARMNEAGKLTVGIGDGGNEIGFGKIYEIAREVVDYGKRCRCPCQGGIVSVTATRHLYPVSVSNWGAYAVAASLAALTRNFTLLHSPTRELQLLDIAARLDCRDGATGEARAWVDGVPGQTSAAITQILKTLAERVNETAERAF